MHSPVTENADGNVIDQHAYDHLDEFVRTLGVSTVELYKSGHSVEACREMLMATRHVSRAAILISNMLRQCGKPDVRETVSFGWTKELTKNSCVEKVRALA